MTGVRACVAIGMVTAPIALQAQVGSVDRVGIYLAALEAFWSTRGSETAGEPQPYHFSTAVAEAQIPGPLFDSLRMRSASIDPDIELRAIETEVTPAERERFETSAAERWRVHMVFASDSILRQVRPGMRSIDLGEAFQARFDGARSLLTISRIAANRDGTVASVDLSSSCGGRCGGGWSYLLQRGTDGWRVVTPSRVGRVY